MLAVQGSGDVLLPLVLADVDHFARSTGVAKKAAQGRISPTRVLSQTNGRSAGHVHFPVKRLLAAMEEEETATFGIGGRGIALPASPMVAAPPASEAEPEPEDGFHSQLRKLPLSFRARKHVQRRGGWHLGPSWRWQSSEHLDFSAILQA
jgi:hypothetical protein